MKKNYILSTILIFFSLFLTSCKNNSNNPVTNNPVGNIFVKSTPSSAQIWLDGSNSGKVTPDTLTNLSVGNHTIILNLEDYFNDTVIVNVQEGIVTLDRSLVIDKSISNYGPIQIWESLGTDSTQPSGIILKTGRPSSIISGGKDSIDLFYSSIVSSITTPTNIINNRNTSFFVGLSAILNDSVMSPTAIPSWVTQVPYSEVNYFFIFDSDFHYSKMIIIDRGGGTSGAPTWIKVQWLYNNKPNDQRF